MGDFIILLTIVHLNKYCLEDIISSPFGEVGRGKPEVGRGKPEVGRGKQRGREGQTHLRGYKHLGSKSRRDNILVENQIIVY